MLVDSHCHIDFPEFSEGVEPILARMGEAGVGHALCVSVSLESFPRVLAVAQSDARLFASVGVHPDHQDCQEPTVDDLVERARHPKVVAIGETGLDYYRMPRESEVSLKADVSEANVERSGRNQAMDWQRDRFRVHIQAARAAGKPLIIHTRSAAEDTLAILCEEGASEVGGVMHCFTESWEVARQALDLGFYISFSGIITFKNAAELREVARLVPLDRLLVETDSPYLAPVPHRGRRNEPAYVRHVAEQIAEIKGLPLEAVAEATTANFFALFSSAGRG